jgi:hypothetical protein
MFQTIAVLVSVLLLGGAAGAQDERTEEGTGGGVPAIEVVFTESEAEVFEVERSPVEMEPLVLTFSVQEITFEPEVIVGVARPQVALAR